MYKLSFVLQTCAANENRFVLPRDHGVDEINMLTSHSMSIKRQRI